MNPIAEAQIIPTQITSFPHIVLLASRWYVRLGLLVISTALLTASFAPANQFYLSWFGLVPWLIVLHSTRSQRSAFFWSWLAGTFFFIANMWWMVYVTSYGMVALMAILGLYWGYAGIIIRGAGLLGTGKGSSLRIENRESSMGDSGSQPPVLHPLSSTLNSLSTTLHPPPSTFNLLRPLLIAAIWIAASEWFRGTWPWHGLPWLYLGSTQTPALFLCQIADITGVAGLSFMIVVINAWVAMWIINGFSLRGLIPSGMMTASLLLGVAVYGLYRMHTEPALLCAGPSVMVVQSNFPQSNSGAKGASPNDLFQFHMKTTDQALATQHQTDLVVWSETMMPPLNPQATREYPDSYGYVSESISALAHDAHAGLLTGAESASQFDAKGEPKERRNSAYLYDRSGHQFPEHYDKIHLVPYGEFIPFRDSVPALYHLAIHFGPPDMEAYALVPGNEQHLTVFPLEKDQPGSAWHFVTPVCFEDIDADICADMFRPEPNTPKLKRADFLVNITNDGWFKANENSQHLQAAIFRSIENRAPTARSVNTGISGFIDPLGHTYGLIPAHSQGTSTQLLQIDPRVTVFTRVGPLFSWICAGVTVLIIAAALVSWLIGLLRGTRRSTGIGSRMNNEIVV